LIDDNNLNVIIPGVIQDDTEEVKAKPIKHVGKYSFDSLISNWRLVKKSLQDVTYNSATNKDAEPKLITINFKDYKLPSPRTGKLKPLTEFKHVCHTLVFFISERLVCNTNNSSIQSAISSRVNILINLYRFLFLRNKYYLKNATYGDLDEYVTVLANGGVYEALNLEPYYMSILKKMKNDESYGKKISSKSDGGVTLSSEMISEIIGIKSPLYNAPKYLYEFAYNLHNVDRKGEMKGFDVGSDVCNLTPKQIRLSAYSYIHSLLTFKIDSASLSVIFSVLLYVLPVNSLNIFSVSKNGVKLNLSVSSLSKYSTFIVCKCFGVRLHTSLPTSNPFISPLRSTL